MADSVSTPAFKPCGGPCVIFDSGDAESIAHLDLSGLGHDLIDARTSGADLEEILRRPWSRAGVVLWIGPRSILVRDFATRAMSLSTTPNLTAVVAPESMPTALRRLGVDGLRGRLYDGLPLAPPDVQPSHVARSWQPYPVELLPQPIRSLVGEMAVALGIDPAFIAVPALAVVASCIGVRRAVGAKGSWQEPAVLWAVVVADSGAGKSPAFAELLRPLVERDVAAMRAYEAELAEHEQSRAASKAMPPAERDELRVPKPPERIVLGDCTSEAVVARLLESPLGMLLARDELGAWFGAFDQYRAGRGADAQRWCEFYDARPVFVDRKGSTPIAVPRAAVSVAGCATPGVVRHGLVGPHNEDGMLARMLLVKPPRSAARWTDRIVGPRTAVDYAKLIERLRALRPQGEEGSFRPVVMPLTGDALDRWAAWYDGTAELVGEASGYEASIRSKARAWALRKALVVQLCRHLHGDLSARPDEVDDASLRAGICLAEWHVEEALRVYVELTGREKTAHNADLLRWIERQGGRVTVRNTQNGGPARFRASAYDLIQALQEFCNEGLGTWEDIPPPVRGGVAPRTFALYVHLPAATCDTRPDERPSHVARPASPVEQETAFADGGEGPGESLGAAVPQQPAAPGGASDG